MPSNLTDSKIMGSLQISEEILAMFKKVRSESILEAKRLRNKKKNRKFKILGISGSAREEFDMAQESSNSEELLKVCLERCKSLGAEVELLPLRKFNIQYCKACYSTTNTQCHFYCSCYPKGTALGDDMTNVLYDKVLEADAIIFATPINNFKISTLMATFIDRCISLDGSLRPANPKSPKNKALNTKHMKYIEMTADNSVPGSGLIKRFTGKVAGIIVTGHEAGASMVISNMFLTLNYFGMLFPPFSSVYAMSSICNSTQEDKPIVLSECHLGEVKLLAENVLIALKAVGHLGLGNWKYDSSKD